MNDNSVLLLSALNLGMQVKVGGYVFFMKETKLFQLDFDKTEDETTLILSPTMKPKNITLSQFIKLSQTMTSQEIINLHNLLSQQGTITHE